MNWLATHLQNSRIWQRVQSSYKNPARVVWMGLVIIAGAIVLYKIVVDWQQIRTVHWHLSPRFLLAGFGVYSISIMLTASCWALIMRCLSGVRTFWEHVRIFCITNLAQRLPTPLPYVAARVEAYTAQGIPREVALAAMTVEITMTLLSATLVAGTTLFFGPYPPTGYINVFLVGLLVLPALLIFSPRLFLAVGNMVLTYLKRPRLVTAMGVRHTLSWAILFVIIWLNSGVLYYFLISSVCIIPKEEVLFLINISAISGLAGWLGQFLFFLPTPAIRQLVIVYLMSLSFPMPVAVAFAIFSRVCVMMFELIWAGACLILPKIFKRGSQGGGSCGY